MLFFVLLLVAYAFSFCSLFLCLLDAKYYKKYKEEGKLFIRVSTLSKNGINLTEEKYLSEKLYQELKKDYEPEVGEILLTKDATPGIAYAIKEPVERIMSGGILRLKLNPFLKKLLPIQQSICLCMFLRHMNIL